MMVNLEDHVGSSLCDSFDLVCALCVFGGAEGSCDEGGGGGGGAFRRTVGSGMGLRGAWFEGLVFGRGGG